MGVKDLWRLLEPTGRPVSLESLEGKVLGVDVSIWLNQAVKGARDHHGNPLSGAHLVVLFHRVCKLLHWHVRPVFVFDGPTPALKLQTQAARRRKRDADSDKSAKAANRHLRKYLQAKILEQMTGEETDILPPLGNMDEDMFHLPPLPGNQLSKEKSPPFLDRSPSPSSYLQAMSVDVHSSDFKCLPPEVQHELLSERQQLERHTHTDPTSLPQCADDFSSYQLSKLVSRSRVSQKLEQVRKVLKASESVAVGLGEEVKVREVEASRVMSSDAKHYILVKGVDMETSSQEEGDSMSGEDGVEKECIVRRMEDSGVAGTVDTGVGRREDAGVAGTVDAGVEGREDAGVGRREDSGAGRREDSGAGRREDSGVGRREDSGGFRLTEADDWDEYQLNRAIEESLAGRGGCSQEEKGGGSLEEVASHRGQMSREGTAMEERNKESCVVGGESVSPPLVGGPDSRQDNTAAKLAPQSGRQVGGCEEVEGGGVCRKIVTTDTTADDEVLAEKCLVGDLVRPEGIVCSTEAVKGGEKREGVEERGEEVEEREDGEEAASRVSEEVGGGEEREGSEEKEMADVLEVFELSAEEAQARLRSEVTEIQQNQSRYARAATAVTCQMYKEAQELLRLFGLPYLTAPGEAEAQCAALEADGLTQGTITDDSDIFLFGGRLVYRHFFNEDRHVECYSLSDVESQLGLSRQQLVTLAYLLGSDYTEGVEGVGVVSAVEALREFPGEGVLEPLHKLRSWYVNSSNQHCDTPLKRKLCQLSLRDDFPNPAVADGYLHPLVDSSQEAFEWGRPDLDLIRTFAQKWMKWPQGKADQLLLPVLKRMRARESRQQKMTTFFPASHPTHPPKAVHSRRLRNAIARLTSRRTEGTDPSIAATPPSKGKRGRGGRRGRGARGGSSGTKRSCISSSGSSSSGDELPRMPEAKRTKSDSKKELSSSGSDSEDVTTE